MVSYSLSGIEKLVQVKKNRVLEPRKSFFRRKNLSIPAWHISLEAYNTLVLNYRSSKRCEASSRSDLTFSDRTGIPRTPSDVGASLAT